MNFYLNIFDNREKAIIIWILILLVGAFSEKKLRSSLLSVLRAFFQIKVLTVIAAMLLYVGLIVFALYKLSLWGVLNIDDTVIWLLGTAFILLMNTSNVLKDKQYFKKVMMDNLKFILVLEIIVNLYTFSLWVEIIIMPLLFVIVFMSVIAETKKECLPAKKIIDVVLFMYGLLLITYTVYNASEDFRGFATIHNLRSILLPPLLTLAFIPFLYLFALIMAYENLYMRLDFFVKGNKALAKYAKLRIFGLCFLNLGRLNKFSRESAIAVSNLENKEDVLNMIQNFNRG